MSQKLCGEAHVGKSECAGPQMLTCKRFSRLLVAAASGYGASCDGFETDTCRLCGDIFYKGPLDIIYGLVTISSMGLKFSFCFPIFIFFGFMNFYGCPLVKTNPRKKKQNLI